MATNPPIRPDPPPPQADESWEQWGVTWRYVLALVVIAVLATVSYLLMISSIDTQASDAAVINISGRQRMLSQRIAQYTARLITPEDPLDRERLRAELRRMADLLVRRHEGLLQGDPELDLPGHPSAAVSALYFQGEHALDPLLRQYAAAARRVASLPADQLVSSNPDVRFVLTVGPRDLLDSLDDMVARYEKESVVAIGRVEMLAAVLWAAMLVVLILEALLIFRPLERRLRRDRDELLAFGNELKEEIRRRTRAEDESRRFFDSAPNLLCVADLDGKLVRVNPAFEKTSGYGAEELTGRPYLDIVHPEDRSRMVQARERHRRGESEEDLEMRLLRKDGTPCWTSWWAMPVPDESLVYAVGRDISEARKNEQSRLTLNSVVENSSELIVLFNLDEEPVYINPAGRSVLGLSRVEALPASLFQITDEETYRRLVDEAIPEALQGHVWEGEGKLHHIRATQLVDVEMQVFSVGQAEAGNPGLLAAVLRDIRARKAAESRIRESERRFRTLADSAPVMIWTCGADSLCTYLNHAWQEYTGETEEAHLGLKWTEAIHPEDRDNTRNRYLDAFDRRAAFEMEYRLRKADGTYGYVWAHGQPHLDEKGAFLGYVGTSVDITELRNTSRHLQRVSLLQQTILNSASYAIISGDKNGLITTFNRAAEKMLGYRADEIVGKETPAIWHDLEEVRQRAVEFSYETGRDIEPGFPVFIEQSRRPGGGNEMEWTYVRKDGSRFPVMLSIAPLRDEDGQINGYLGVSYDITERKRGQEQLQESENRFRSLFEDAVIPLWEEDFSLVKSELDRLRDRPGVQLATDLVRDRDVVRGLISRIMVLNVNHAAVAFHGVRDKRVLLEPPAKIWLCEAGDTAERMILALAEGRTEFSCETTMRTAGFQEKSILMKMKIAAGHENDWSRVLVSMLDISDLKRAEADLHVAMEEAQAANRAKSEFLATMSHEIRTPMNGVIGMAELLMQCEMGAKEREYARSIRVSGENLLSIINDILDFSKIEAGRMEMNPAPFHLRRCFENSLELFALRAGEKHLELTLHLDPELPDWVDQDEGRLRQVLVNLIGNAVKFTSAGSVHIEARLRGGDDGSVVLGVEVVDTGIGITPENRARLFEPFSQVDASINRRYGGTGLGLAICRRIVHLLGGEIGVQSEPGVGTTFHFTLPCRRVSPDNVPPEPSATADFEGCRVLLVDDNETNLNILQEHCAGWKLDTAIAASATHALERAGRGEKFDLVILDMHMPGMDGAELAAAWHRLPPPHPPLVLLSSIGNEVPKEVSGHFAAVLGKPVRQHALHGAIAQALGGRAEAVRTGHLANGRQPGEAMEDGTLDLLGQGLRILIAEDQPINQQVALGMLEHLGCRAEVGNSGYEVLDRLEHGDYDIVLMDVQMPGMDGLETTRRIRRSRPHGRPYIIAMTANAIEGDREDCLNAGMDDYLSKPLLLAQLAKALRRAAENLHLSSASRLVGEKEAAAPAAAPPPRSVGVPASTHGRLSELLEILSPETLREIVDTFRDDVDGLLERVTTTARDEQWGELHKAAHTLKGAAGNLGLDGLASRSAQVERLSDARDAAALGSVIDTLIADVAAAKEHLESFLQEVA